ncbi:hypothetical protein TNCT_576621 [Trichonephila clavata]|uniref:Uncharacterized protein n=1 Tax=Trichonephila clavata TaxID=2740835 RepID=A0A8X6HKH7_TRICU|nr:hypothetical protein TNCT_576621 [Trichonephila clavata]
MVLSCHHPLAIAHAPEPPTPILLGLHGNSDATILSCAHMCGGGVRNFRSPHNFPTCWPAQFASGHPREKMPRDRGEDYCKNTPFNSQGGDRRGNPEGARPGGPKRGASRGGPQP